ncbi:MAG TPA: IS21 family transposase [Bryobacteraceae bacterium]
MADIQAILALHGLGWSCRRIAQKLGIHRETVGHHVRQVDAKPASAPTGSSGPITEPDAVHTAPGSEGAPAGSEEARGDVPASKPASAPSGSESAPAGNFPDEAGLARGSASVAWPWREVIGQKLDAGLSAQRIYQDLIEPPHGYSGSYYSVRRLIQKLAATSPLPMRRMECEAGHEAQVDFGRGAPIALADGKRRTTWVFRIVLSHSRKAYAEAVFRQTTDDFLRCLENAFAYFGGVPRTLVIDNLRAAVKQPDWFDPELCPKMRSFASHYGTAVLPTKSYTPRHKGKIESGVKYVKGNALKGHTFNSLAEQNQHLLEWEGKVADLRIHGTTRQQVIRIFQEVEKPTLLPLPPSRFELFHEALRRVNRDGHVQVQEAYYSVPPEFLGQEIWARWDGRMVRLFDRKMKPIALHSEKPPGKFSTLSIHLHPHKISGIEKGADYLLLQVDRIGPKARAWAQAMLQNRGIEGVRVLMGLIALGKQQPRQAVERACEVALGHGAYHLRSLRQLIKHSHRAGTTGTQQTFEFASEHPIIRPVADYEQWLNEALTQQQQQENLP